MPIATTITVHTPGPEADKHLKELAEELGAPVAGGGAPDDPAIVFEADRERVRAALVKVCGQRWAEWFGLPE